MTKTQLYMDFTAAKAKASQLEEQASRLEKSVNGEYSNGVNTARTAWKGEAADAFRGKADKLAGQTKQTAANLKKVAAAIRQAAQTVYNAEMRALEIAEARTYK